jgi:hypothetical protein
MPMGRREESEAEADLRPVGRCGILVLGMHRSGTSALTRALGLCGAELPAHLIEPDAATNETGFWEPRELVALNDAVLASAGSYWHDLRSLPAGWFGTHAAAEFRRRAAALLSAELGRSALSVVKDPRLCRLLPLWRPVLAELGIEPRIVILVRNPLEVAASVNRRDHFGEGKALLLWLRHLLDAERDSRGLRRCIVSYDQLLDDWRATMARIGRTLALVWPRGLAEAAAEIDAFLSPHLRHFALSPAALLDRPDIPDQIKVAYCWALRAAEGLPAPADSLDRIHAEIGRAEAIFGPAVAALDEAAQLQAERLHHWVGVAVERYDVIEQLRGAIAQLNSAARPEG